MVRPSLVLPLVAALLGVAPRALGQSAPRVAVGPVVGVRANVARGVLASVLNDHAGEITSVPESEFTTAAIRLGLDGLAGDDDIARVARELHLDGVVVGEISHRGARDHLFRVRVARGRDGTTVGTASWEIHQPTDVLNLQNEIWEQIQGFLRSLGAGGSSVSASSGSGGSSSGSSGGGSSDGGATSAGAGSTAVTTPGLGVVYLQLGGGGSMRYWRLPVLGELSPRGYENGGYGELRVEGMLLYRFANDRMGVGIAASVGIPLGLASRAINADDTTGRPVELATSAVDASGGAAFAVRPAGGGHLRAQFGFAAQFFNVETMRLSLAQRLAPVSYVGPRLAFDAALPIFASDRFEFSVLFGTDLRIVGVSTEIRNAFGDAPGTTLGLGATLGLLWRLDLLTPGFGARFTADMMRYRTPFAGRYDIGPASDSIDDYWRFQVAVSYAIDSHMPRNATAATPAASATEPSSSSSSGTGSSGSGGSSSATTSPDASTSGSSSTTPPSGGLNQADFQNAGRDPFAPGGGR